MKIQTYGAILAILIERATGTDIMTTVIDKLLDEHRAVRAAVDHLAALLNGSYEDAAPHLYAARADVSRKAMRCLQLQEEWVLAPLRQRGLLSHIASSGRVDAQTRELRLHYSAHIVEWTVSAIERDWPGYVASARKLHVRLRDLTAVKEREFYPEAARLLGIA